MLTGAARLTAYRVHIAITCNGSKERDQHSHQCCQRSIYASDTLTTPRCGHWPPTMRYGATSRTPASQLPCTLDMLVSTAHTLNIIEIAVHTTHYP
jgi:hypothetical protein